MGNLKIKPGEIAACSMTGFGRGSAGNRNLRIDVEIKSVNHRFLDVSAKLPRSCSAFEAPVRELVAAKLARGRVEVYVTRRLIESAAENLQFDSALFKKVFDLYLITAREQAGMADLGAAAELELRGRILCEVMRRSEVFDLNEELLDEAQEKELLTAAVNAALDEVCAMRRSEGAKLAADLALHLQRIVELRSTIKDLSADAPATYREKLNARLARFAPEVMMDETRLAQEVALFADRIDVTEEIVRIESHVTGFKEALSRPNNGRRLEFIVQELGREFNTIASKAQDGEVQGHVIEARQELERIREQLQNLE